MQPSFFETWSRQEVIGLFEGLYQELSAEIPSGTKKALFVEGLAGVGKSSYAAAYQKEHPEFMYLAVDDLIARSPDYQKTEISLNDKYSIDKYPNFHDLMDFVVYASRHIIDRTMAEGKSIIVDGLSGQTLRSKIKAFANLGYQVEAVALSSPKRMLDINILSRFVYAKSNPSENRTMIMANLRKPERSIRSSENNINQFEYLGCGLKVIDRFSNKVLYETKNKRKNDRPGSVFIREYGRMLTPEEQAEISLRQNILRKKIQELPEDASRKRFYLYVLNSCNLPFTYIQGKSL